MLTRDKRKNPIIAIDRLDQNISVGPPPGFDRALATFRDAARRVPAYKNFLTKHGIDSSAIKTYTDFIQVPEITKENYLTRYPFKDLLLDGVFDNSHIISMSSGSSGQPFFWPRGEQSAQECTQLHETLFSNNFDTLNKETLVIIAFAMGTWIAGTYTLGAMLEMKKRGHKIVTVTPGIDKIAVVRLLEKMSPEFEQTILMGYPPFIKDILDEASDARVNLAKLSLKTVFAGEIISEPWRDYILKKIKKPDDLFVSANIYGTADAGLLGNETPVSIFARRQSLKDPALYEQLFDHTTIVPSLVHYDPSLRFFEKKEGNLLFTVNNALPLVRYKILDQGRIISSAQLLDILAETGHPLPTELQKIKQEGYIVIYGRSDLATTFYALDIYPENIKYGLEGDRLSKHVTGKFVVKTLYDDASQEQTLHLYIELKNNVETHQKIEKMVLESVIKSLKTHNSEYNRLYQELEHKANPKVHLLPYESPEFTIKIKQRWTQ